MERVAGPPSSPVAAASSSSASARTLKAEAGVWAFLPPLLGRAMRAPAAGRVLVGPWHSSMTSPAVVDEFESRFETGADEKCIFLRIRAGAMAPSERIFDAIFGAVNAIDGTRDYLPLRPWRAGRSVADFFAHHGLTLALAIEDGEAAFRTASDLGTQLVADIADLGRATTCVVIPTPVSTLATPKDLAPGFWHQRRGLRRETLELAIDSPRPPSSAARGDLWPIALVVTGDEPFIRALVLDPPEAVAEHLLASRTSLGSPERAAAIAGRAAARAVFDMFGDNGAIQRLAPVDAALVPRLRGTPVGPASSTGSSAPPSASRGLPTSRPSTAPAHRDTRASAASTARSIPEPPSGPVPRASSPAAPALSLFPAMRRERDEAHERAEQLAAQLHSLRLNDRVLTVQAAERTLAKAKATIEESRAEVKDLANEVRVTALRLKAHEEAEERWRRKYLRLRHAVSVLGLEQAIFEDRLPETVPIGERVRLKQERVEEDAAILDYVRADGPHDPFAGPDERLALMAEMEREARPALASFLKASPKKEVEEPAPLLRDGEYALRLARRVAQVHELERENQDLRRRLAALKVHAGDADPRRTAPSAEKDAEKVTKEDAGKPLSTPIRPIGGRLRLQRPSTAKEGERGR